MNYLKRSGLLPGMAVFIAAQSLMAIDMSDFTVFKGQKYSQTSALGSAARLG